jgi:predicted acylesterase/phospholipase RssA
MSNTQSSGHLDLRQVLADEYNKVLAEKNEEEIDPKKESLSTIYKHFYDKRPTALCLSGGGIRSATFGLGVIQGLAHYGLLDKFHYLSTVSGGGYIGSWLTAWIHREQKDSEQPGQGLAQVTAQLDPMQSSPRQLPAPAPRAHGKLTSDPEPGPIRRLRQYSNYLTPRLGLLSADTWTWIAIYLRNLILNWLVLIPLML